MCMNRRRTDPKIGRDPEVQLQALLYLFLALFPKALCTDLIQTYKEKGDVIYYEHCTDRA